VIKRNDCGEVGTGDELREAAEGEFYFEETHSDITGRIF
jgi:hypothetical protein